MTELDIARKEEDLLVIRQELSDFRIDDQGKTVRKKRKTDKKK